MMNFYYFINSKVLFFYISFYDHHEIQAHIQNNWTFQANNLSFHRSNSNLSYDLDITKLVKSVSTLTNESYASQLCISHSIIKNWSILIFNKWSLQLANEQYKANIIYLLLQQMKGLKLNWYLVNLTFYKFLLNIFNSNSIY